MSTVEFNQMLVSNTDFLKPFAFTLTRDNETAKDLLQETMFRALANKDKYNVGTNIKAWLYTIMRNIFINNYRRRVKQNTIFDSTPNDFFINYQQATVSNDAEASMKLKEIQNAVHQLPIFSKILSCSILKDLNTTKLQKHLKSLQNHQEPHSFCP